MKRSKIITWDKIIKASSLPSTYNASAPHPLKVNTLKNFNYKSCFVNAIVQSLGNTTEFRKVLLKTQVQLPPWQTSIFAQVKRLFTLLKTPNLGTIEPSFLYTKDQIRVISPELNLTQQHDATEFLNGLLDRLQEEEFLSNGTSLIKFLICGQTQKIISCNAEKCTHQSDVRVQEFTLHDTHGSF